MRKTIVTQLPSESETHSQLESQTEHSAPTPTPQPRRSSRQAHASTSTIESPRKPQDPITFLAELNVSFPLVATIAQEIISLYSLWDRYKEDATPDATKASRDQASSPFAGSGSGNGNGGGSGSPSKRSAPTASRSSSLNTNSNSNSGTPLEVKDDGGATEAGWGDGTFVTPMYLSAMLTRMREVRLADMAHPASGRPHAVNKMLERAQAAG